MNVNYPALFEKKGSSYSVVFPDLNGLSTFGNSYEEAVAMSVDLLAGEFHYAKHHQKEVPKPSTPDRIHPVGSEFLVMISVDPDEYAKTHFDKPVKKTLAIPKWLDDTAKEKGIKFSKVLQKALKQELDIPE